MHEPLYTIDPFDPGDELLDAKETALVLAQVSKRKKVSLPVVYDAWNVGRAGVRLPSLHVVGRRMTSRKALRWWLQTTSTLLHEQAELERATPGSEPDPMDLARARALGLEDEEATR